MRRVAFSAHMRPTARALFGAAPAGQERSHVSGGRLELRVSPCDDPRVPAGTYLWGIVEVWPNGHEEILLGSHAPDATQASIAALPHYERLRAERG